MADLSNIATAMSFEGEGRAGGTLIEKTITENGTYNAADDSAGGYSVVHVMLGNMQPLTVTQNGDYEAWEYGCDGFNPVTVNVPAEFTFCDTVDYNDISPYVDFDNYRNYLYDLRIGFGVRVSVENEGRRLRLYKVATDGTETQIYEDSSQYTYSNAYVEVADSSTGEIDIKYTLSNQPQTEITDTETISSIEQYGGDGHGFMIRSVAQ